MRARIFAVVGTLAIAPVLVGLFVVIIGARGPSALTAVGAAIALLLSIGSSVIAIRTRRGLGVAALAPNLVLVLFLSTYCGSALPRPAPLRAPLPSATPPAEMRAFQLSTGVTHRTAAFAYRGGSLFAERDFVMTAVLVNHPRGDLLIDTGLGRNIDTQIHTLPIWLRAATGYERRRSAAEQLDAAGYDRAALRAIVLTHAHWDHASGIPEFPGKPVWVTAEEHAHVVSGGAIMALTRSLEGVRYAEYGFEGGPYLGFPRSHDVYGDGSIVIVPAPGHTPGSVIVFLVLPGEKRFALIGDLVWQLEGVTERQERPWLNRMLADSDPGAVRESIGRVAAIAARYPEIAIVPAHDARGFASLPTLPVSAHR